MAIANIMVLSGFVRRTEIGVRRAINPTLSNDLPPFGIAASIGVALLVGALAGLYPARRAARIPPAEAVRK
jgi:putative ABC transport system permease protein